MMDRIGAYSVPALIAGAALVILISKKALFDEFIKGCRDGFVTTVRLLPSLIVLICAVNMFSASGALDVICKLAGSLFGKLGLPEGILPVIITRPISGSAATAMTNKIFAEYGPDSFTGRCVSVLMGSTDTIIYTLAMYFGAAGVKKTRYALPAAFILFVFCIAASVAVTRLFF